MKIHKRLISILITMLIITGTLSLSCSAGQYVQITGTKTAVVTDIVDGDAIEVRLQDTNELAMVKLVGITCQGYDKAREYLTSRLKGALVILSPDSSLSGYDGMWNYMYVTYNGVNINQEMVEKGYAVADTSQSNASLYNSMVEIQRDTRNKNLQIWNYGVNSSSTVGGVTSGSNGNILNSYATDSAININTAEATTLHSRMSGVSVGLANNIVDYRKKNPFNDIKEIKFVSGMTREIYDANKNMITVNTNITKADEEELETLGDIKDTEIEKIISYRSKDHFDEVSRLKSKSLIRESLYNRIEPYVSLSNDGEIDATEGRYVTNINVASVSQLTTAGVPSEAASKIIEYRTNGYTFKTVMEIAKIPGITLSESDLNVLEDTMHVRTNVNTAKDTELNSVFGDGVASRIRNNRWYKSIENVYTTLGDSSSRTLKDILYVGSDKPEYVNLNTASVAQLRDAGFGDKATTIENNRSIETAKDLPFDISAYNSKAALYTNINKASKNELRSLNGGITDSIVEQIIIYTNDQPFGSMEEVRSFFSELGASSVYDSIKKYIVLR